MSDIPTRVPKAPWSHLGSYDMTMPSSAYNRASWRLTSCPRLLRSYALSAITVTKCCTTTPTTALNMVKDSGSPCVTPLEP